MIEPDDYGLSDSQTLLQVGDSTPPPGFLQHWSEWSSRVWGQQATLKDITSETRIGDPGAGGVTHVLNSLDGVRVGCRLIHPTSGHAPQAVVITSHGYGMSPGEALTDQSPWQDKHIAVLKVRVRGYPGSQFDTGDLTSSELGYVTHSIESRLGWVLCGAVADIVNAVRAARDWAGPSVPLMLHGESFGGGLAVIAASQLAGRITIARMALGLPSLGWWPWRLSHRAHAGIGFEVTRYLSAQREHAAPLIEHLRLLDAMVHARRVTCPLVCKVALRDDVVPAPTAAAVYNAVAADPGLKWRFVTRYGHFDGGLSDLRRHAMFERLAGEFLDPGELPERVMARWEPVLIGGERAP